MSVLKIVAALLVIAGGALVGAAVGGAFDSTEVTDKAETIKVVKREPTTFSFLASEIKDNSSDYGNDKVGGKYKNYLVAVYGTNDSNKKWWEESYERYRKTDSKNSLADEFGNDKIDKGFAPKSTSLDPKALNQVCDTLYKKTLTDSVSHTSNSTKYKKAVWTYCSDLKDVPKTVKESEGNQVSTLYQLTSGNSIGKDKQEDLLSTKNSINDKLWVWKQKEFFALEESTVTEKYFETLRKDNSKKLDKNSLKKACEEAYKKKNETQDADDKLKGDTVLKYCSLKGAAA